MVKHFIKNDGENTNWELATVVIAFIEVEFVFVFVAIFVSVDFNFEDDVNFRVIVDLVVVWIVSFSCFISLSSSFLASKSKLKYKQILMKRNQVTKAIVTLPGAIIADNCK